MIISEEFTNFFIILLKCFLILTFFGLLLPRFLDYFLYNFINKANAYDNSLFVYNIFHKNEYIIYNYINIFSEFLKL